MTRLESIQQYTIAWITALPIGLAAAKALLDERHDPPADYAKHDADSNVYVWGKMTDHNVVIASLPAGMYGAISASMTACSLLASLPHIRIGLLVGIGGAIVRPDQGVDIRLGDVVVSQPTGAFGGVVQYDLGEYGGDGKWTRLGTLNKPPKVLLSALAALESEYEVSGSKIPELLDQMWSAYPLMKTPRKKKEPGYIYQGTINDRLFAANYNHVDDNNTCQGCDATKKLLRDDRGDDGDTDPEIHYGTIASGNTMVHDAIFRDQLAAATAPDCICFEMEAAGLMDHFPCLVIRGISDYCDSHKNNQWQRYASATAAAYAKELLEHVPSQELQRTQFAMDIKAVQESMALLQTNTTLLNKTVQQLGSTISLADQQRVISTLPVAEGAAFNSFLQQDGATCLPETRTEILTSIESWTQDADAQNIFWFNGMAGTGKSTISRTICQSLNTKKALAASFFFQRGEADRNSLSKFVTTLAASLAKTLPRAGSYIKTTMDNDQLIATKNTREQFLKLFLEPISKYIREVEAPPGPLVVVIDALDECESHDQIKLLLDLISYNQTEGALEMVKFFITSRPEVPLRFVFGTIRGRFQNIVLHEIPPAIVQQDITIFINYELSKTRNYYNILRTIDRQLPQDWPSPSIVDSLVTMAIPLFVYASAVCLFIGDRRYANPEKQLSKILNRRLSSSSLTITDTYEFILGQQIKGMNHNDRDNVVTEFSDIVGPLIALATPLSMTTLSGIIGISRDIIQDRLELLHSVLHVPNSDALPIKFLHQSFRDFLSDSANRKTNLFWIDEKEVHNRLLKRCFEKLSSLKYNLCDLNHSMMSRTAITPEQVNSKLGPEMQYWCKYWVHHVEKSECLISDGLDVHIFLQSCFLFWVEALILLGRALEIPKQVASLRKTLKPNESSELLELLDDATMFLLVNLHKINQNPLQIYSSALLFAPGSSKIRTIYHEHISHMDATTSCRSWNSCIQTLVGHNSSIYSLAISGDSTRLVSGGYGQDVRVWDIGSGECTHVFKGHRDSIYSVAPSYDGSTVVSSSADKTIRQWSLVTAECTRIIDTKKSLPFAIALSPDAKRIAAGLHHDATVRLWSSSYSNGNGNDDYIWVGKGHKDWIQCVRFSHDSKLLASASKDTTVRVWEVADSGKCLWVLEGHTLGVTSIAFARNPTLRLIATSAPDHTVRLWDTGDGSCVRVIHDRDFITSSIDLSSDCLSAMAGSTEGEIKDYNIATGECAHHIYTGERKATNVTCVPGSPLVIAVNGADICFWRTGKEGARTREEETIGSPVSVVISHNLAYIACSSKHALDIWRAEHIEYVKNIMVLDGNISTITFSHDSTLIMAAINPSTSSYKSIIRIWQIDTGKLVKQLQAPDELISICPYPSFENIVCIYKRDTPNAVVKLSLSPQRKLDIAVLDIETGQIVLNINRPDGSMPCVAVSFGSSIILSGSDTAIFIRDAKTGKHLKTLYGSLGSINAVAISPDSSIVAASTHDGMLLLWHLDTGKKVYSAQIGINHGASEYELRFGVSDTHELRLISEFGVVLLHGLPSGPLSKDFDFSTVRAQHSGYGLDRKYLCLTWNGERIMDQPQHLNFSIPVVAGGSFMMSCKNGDFYFFRLPPPDL